MDILEPNIYNTKVISKKSHSEAFWGGDLHFGRIEMKIWKLTQNQKNIANIQTRTNPKAMSNKQYDIFLEGGCNIYEVITYENLY